jgi:gamma-glutamylcyclotransferase (GGCT)/AIG2-like uncharacterized protein YtfP
LNSVNSIHSDQPYRVPTDPVDLFAYGSLQFPEVLRVLLGRAPSISPATVAGWRVAALPGQIHPALVPAPPTVRTAGNLVTGLSPTEWRTLDAFEDHIYDLRRLTLTDGRVAWAYISSDSASASPDDWDLHSFERDHLTEYLKRCAAWRASPEF